MTINFEGTGDLKGYHTSLRADPPQAKVIRRHFFGLNGETEIFGGKGGRVIQCDMLLTDKNWKAASDVRDYLNTLDSIVGDHGELKEYDIGADELSDPDPDTLFPDCTFMGATPRSIEGREDWSIQRDQFGGLFPGDPEDFINNGGSYFTLAVLRWYQLLSGREAP